MSLAKYDKYKPSEIDLLDEIPKDWKVSRLKALGDIRYGLGQPPKQMENGLPIIRATNVSCGKITTKDMLFVDPNDLPYDRKPILKTNEIIVVRSGAYTGDSAIIPEEYAGSVTGYDMVFTPKYINPKFIAFSILSNYIFKDQLVISSLRAAQPHLNKEELGNTLVSIPPLPEQSSIATYLDCKTSAIDRKVALLEQKITHYQQLRKSLINETVCRGLNKNVKLKDSGIEWIGEIPVHWEVKRGKEILNVKYGFPLDSDSFSNNENDGFPIIRIRDLNNQVVQTYYQKGIVKEALVSNGALLTGMDGDFQTVIWEGGAALLNQRICELKGTKKMNTRFLYYSFPLAIKVINEMKFYTTVKHLSDADLKIINVFCPPISEQIAIANFRRKDPKDRQHSKQQQNPDRNPKRIA